MSILQAYTAYQRGDINLASHWAEVAFMSSPVDPQVLLVYGMIKQARGEFEAASRAFKSLTRLQPAEPAHWVNLATAQRAAGHLELAVEGYLRASHLAGWTPTLRYNMALLEMERGRLPQAMQHLECAIANTPVDAEIGCLYAHALMQTGEPAALRHTLSNWQSWQRWNQELLADAALMLLAAGDKESALGIIEGLLVSPNPQPAVELTLICLLERTNRLEDANQRLSRLCSSEERIPVEMRDRWLSLRAHMAMRQGEMERAVDIHRELLSREIPIDTRQDILFPMANALDTLGRGAEAFEAVTSAHQSQMAFLRLLCPDVGDDASAASEFQSAGCDPADVQKWTDLAPPPATESPIFILGFPRSGTTLLEQIMDAHPKLETMDEQRFLLDAQVCLQDQGIDYPKAMADATSEQLQTARRHYWRQVAGKVTLAPGQRLLDKNPLNMVRLPVIMRLWPQARIILMVRHPLDVIISNFFQHYRAPEFAKLCCDLPTLCSGYACMYEQWYAAVDVLRPRVFEIKYESLISDVEGYSRRLADFCELDWSEAMLEPAKNAQRRGYIGTPSYHQVVKPITDQAVGRWRAHEENLRELVPRLSALLERWGYAV